MIYSVRHFEAREFLCPCCAEGRVAVGLVLFLDLLRAAWGAPVEVTSGWRCWPHNAEVGGSANSRHKIGCAADVRIARGDRFADFMALARRLCVLPGWEVRVYNTFIHIAAPREEETRVWDGSAIYI